MLRYGEPAQYMCEKKPSASTEVATLYAAPSVLSLPSADPNAIIAEAWLRLSSVAYRTVVAPHHRFGLELPDKGGRLKKISSLRKILELVQSQRQSKSAAEAVVEKEEGLTLRLLVDTCLVPAFTFLLYSDIVLYKEEIQEKVDKVVTSRLERLISGGGFYRQGVLSRSAATLGAAVLSEGDGSPSFPDPDDVIQQVTEACDFLEAKCRRRSTALQTLYISGSPHPTVHDARVFGAVSGFIHGDLSIFSKQQTTLGLVQAHIQANCPALAAYAELVRSAVFDHQSSTYGIHYAAHSPTSLGVDPPDVYAKGRAKTILFTVSFGIFYFLLSSYIPVIAEQVRSQGALE